jgi:hypothetical protein
VGKWTVGIKEKGTFGERKLESGVGGVLWTVRAPVRTAGPVRMMRLVGVIRFVRMIGLMRVTRLMRMIRMIRLVWVIWVIRMLRRLRFTGMMRGLGFLWRMRLAVMSLPAVMLDLLRLRPLDEVVAFQFLVRIESDLQLLSASQVSRVRKGRTNV